MKTILISLSVVLLAASFSIDVGATEKQSDKKAIVLAVFGTSKPEAVKSILNLKSKMEQAFPQTTLKIAFTSNIIRGIWQKRDNDPKWKQAHPEIPAMLYRIKNPLATIADLQSQGYRSIAVQSTHIFAGEEYENLQSEVKALASIKTLRDRDIPFKKIFLGRPALGAPSDRHPYHQDVARAAEVLEPDVALAKKNKSALVYMGHGNEIFSTGAYIELEAVLREAHPDVPIFIGAVEGFPGPERVLAGLKHAGVKKITMIPLMVVAGDHAVNDMAGDEPDSWKNLMKAAGITVLPVLRGLGEVDAWNDIYIQHLKEAMEDNGF